jgi:hypothetical protein
VTNEYNDGTVHVTRDDEKDQTLTAVVYPSNDEEDNEKDYDV